MRPPKRFFKRSAFGVRRNRKLASGVGRAMFHVDSSDLSDELAIYESIKLKSIKTVVEEVNENSIRDNITKK